MHTVFSDGSVWPNIRVQEAIKDGLDAIAVTDHLEYQPHKNDIPHPDRNRSFEIALEAAKGKDLIVIKGAEITRAMPPGHANAVFLKDVNKLLKDDVMEVFREAKSQGAFIFWNHPHWTSQKPNGIAELTQMHIDLISEGLLNGIEIVNEHTFSEEALQIALDHNLTLMSNSDIHGLIDWEFDIPAGKQRPLTFVFASEKSEQAIKKAMEEGRTAIIFKNTLVGKEEFLAPLIKECLQLRKTKVLSGTNDDPFIQSLYIENISSSDFILENISNFSFHSHSNTFTIPAGETEVIDIKTVEPSVEFEISFKVMNAYIAPKENLNIKFIVKSGSEN
jgi:histidinol phosphatase-like PHP family hydrolase